VNNGITTTFHWIADQLKTAEWRREGLARYRKFGELRKADEDEQIG
jgi:hypothetical protein